MTDFLLKLLVMAMGIVSIIGGFVLLNMGSVMLWKVLKMGEWWNETSS